MKVLITGGAGFISKHLTQLFLLNGISVRWFDNLDVQVHGQRFHTEALTPANVEFLVGDVCSRELWVKAIDGIDCIVHFAALTGTGQSMYQVEKYSQVNIGGTSLMWDVLANHPHRVKRVMIASSRSIYGEGLYDCTGSCGSVVPAPRQHAQLSQDIWNVYCPNCGQECLPIATTESAQPQPASLYACSKLAQEHISLTMGKALQIPTVAMRFQNVYGPGQSLQNPYTGIISIFSNQLRQNLTVNIYEDGKESRDFVYVGDVADICFQNATKSDCESLILNVGSGEPTSVYDLAIQLKTLWNSDSVVEVTGDFRLGDIRHNWADLSLLHQYFPQWQPTPLDKGLQKFVEWARTQDVYEDRSKSAYQELKQRNL